MKRPSKPAATITRAKQLRRQLSLPEALLWRELKAAPRGLHFRKQHAAGNYVLDFFCARANLAIEVDGIAHDMGDQPSRDAARDAWLQELRIDTLRIAARDVLRSPADAAGTVVALVCERLERFGKTPPSGLRPATSPSKLLAQVDGEDHAA